MFRASMREGRSALAFMHALGARCQARGTHRTIDPVCVTGTLILVRSSTIYSLPSGTVTDIVTARTPHAARCELPRHGARHSTARRMRHARDPARLRVLDHRVEVATVDAKLVGESQRRESSARDEPIDRESISKPEVGRNLYRRQEPLHQARAVVILRSGFRESGPPAFGEMSYATRAPAEAICMVHCRDCGDPRPARPWLCCLSRGRLAEPLRCRGISARFVLREAPPAGGCAGPITRRLYIPRRFHAHKAPPRGNA